MARITLIEAGPRLLAAFPEPLSLHARKVLERRGVTVLTGEPVKLIEQGRVTVGDRIIEAATIVWGAGVHASPAGKWLDLPVDHSGRIAVNPDLSVPGREGVYAIGDTAAVAGKNGKPLPALGQVAKQQGHALGRSLRANLLAGKTAAAVPVSRSRQHRGDLQRRGCLRLSRHASHRLYRLGVLGARPRLSAHRLPQSRAGGDTMALAACHIRARRAVDHGQRRPARYGSPSDSEVVSD